MATERSARDDRAGGTVRWEIAGRVRQFHVLAAPTPHIVVDSSKELHGWWPGKRECTSERMLINPYNGCEFACQFCYANWLDWGYFRLYRHKRIVTVFDKLDLKIARQLDSIDVATCGYLSPVTDPFQPVNGRYRLSEKIINVFVQRGIPIEIITKGLVPDEAIALLAQNPHSFLQVSIVTISDRLRRRISSGIGPSIDQLFDNIKRASRWPTPDGHKLHTVCRIDPILPFITDSTAELRTLVQRAKDAGADHIVASCVDLPISAAKRLFALFYSLNQRPKVPYESLFCERIDGSLNARIDYRKELFSKLRELCVENELSFALCMEFERLPEPVMVNTASGRPKPVFARGLNREFMTGCNNCEGIDIPVYVRDFSGASGFYIDVDNRRRPRFHPAVKCDGACLTCRRALCGIEDLAMGRSQESRKDFTLRDYRRWSKRLAQSAQAALFGSQRQ